MFNEPCSPSSGCPKGQPHPCFPHVDFILRSLSPHIYILTEAPVSNSELSGSLLGGHWRITIRSVLFRMYFKLLDIYLLYLVACFVASGTSDVVRVTLGVPPSFD